jgi:DNA-binding response OmpR family regulator
VNLEIEGYQVITAHHGEEAVEKARVEVPDLVILTS